ncbi:MAG: site-2 protease family protein [Firmicutes bacterium]|nr:site-2 protease family protein [Bacillota bacterium]
METNMLIEIALRIPAILIVTTIHEFSRAAISTALGDTLPRQNKRLTLNPIKHFEPIGFILMLSMGCGWGKPVDTSALNYKNRKQGVLLTAVLPTIINIAVAPVFLWLSGEFLLINVYLSSLFMFAFYYNLSLAVYNLFPVKPMDCLKVLSVVLPANKYFKFVQYENIIQAGFLLLLFINVLTLIVSPLLLGLSTMFYALVY